MKYLCLGYMAEKKWEEMSPEERDTFVEECLAYDEILRRNGHMVGGEALQSVRTATTMRFKQGKLSITDGPFAETNEQLGGIMVLEARDLNHVSYGQRHVAAHTTCRRTFLRQGLVSCRLLIHNCVTA